MKIKQRLLGSFVWSIAVMPKFLIAPKSFFDVKKPEEKKMAEVYYSRASQLLPSMTRASVIATRTMLAKAAAQS